MHNTTPATTHAARMLRRQCSGCAAQCLRLAATDDVERGMIKLELDCSACGGHEMVRVTYDECAGIPGFDLTLVAHFAVHDRHHARHARDLKTKIHKWFPRLANEAVRIDEMAGASYVDVSLPEYHADGEHVVILVSLRGHTPASSSCNAPHEGPGVRYGFSIVDADTGYGDGADCEFGHVNKMLAYMKRLFPLAT